MKRWVVMLLSILMLLGLASCAAAPEPETSIPEETDALVYDMQNYEFFAHIFEERSVEEWTAMGRYTIRLDGLHTSVVVNMDGTDVVSICAYDQTVELGEAGLANDYHDGYSPVYYIGSTKDAVVIRVSGGEMDDDSILITNGRSYAFQQEADYDTNFYVREDGTLKYIRTWLDPVIFDQMWYYALESVTRRDALLYESGSAEFAEDGLRLIEEETVTASDLYDLDAMFAEAKAAGEFEEYDSLDELLAANEARINGE